MRLVLREQLDRRFVPGLLLCESKLSVWLCDRAGILGTNKLINIHAVCHSNYYYSFPLITYVTSFLDL